jgi:hypothetical protein
MTSSGKTIALSELNGVGTEFLDIKANVTAVSDYETNINTFLYCKQKEIIKKLFAQLSINGCCDDCKKEKECMVMEVYNAYTSLEFAISSGNLAKINDLLEFINSYENVNVCQC